MELPNFHDGYFEGLRILGDHVVELYLRSAGREKFTFELRGVQRMGIWEVREGNIIFDLVERDAAGATAEDVKLLGLDGPDGPDLNYLARLQSSKWKMLEINSSYGANGLIVFERGELRQIANT